MQDKFKEGEIFSMLDAIGKHLAKKTPCHIFGGAAMVFRGLKVTTKDIDLIFDNRAEMETFVSAAEKAGFATVKIPRAYERLEISCLLENCENNWRLDIFLGRFAGKMRFTHAMKKRAKPLREFHNLNALLLSNEDIFILKSITERKRDLEDMKLLLGFGLDWKVIESEMLAQDDFIIHTFPGISQLTDEYGIDINFSGKLKVRYEEKMEEWADKTEKRLSGK
ncbi:MAG: DUF6036 family nucleotidyltransferase [Candidatus Diapherotrites archaeon]